jgi:hypothetical protein
MIDAPAAIFVWTTAYTPLTALTGDRVWSEMNNPPPGYKPTAGPALTFRIRGGAPDYSRSHLNPSVQFKCYGLDAGQANELYRVLYDRFELGGGYGIKAANVDVLGQTLNDQDTDWFFVLMFGSFWLNAS